MPLCRRFGPEKKKKKHQILHLPQSFQCKKTTPPPSWRLGLPLPFPGEEKIIRNVQLKTYMQLELYRLQSEFFCLQLEFFCLQWESACNKRAVKALEAKKLNLSAPNHKSQSASDFKSWSPNRKNSPKSLSWEAEITLSNRAICDLQLCSKRR